MNRFILLPLLLLAFRAFGSDEFVVVTDSHGVGEFGASLSNWLRSRKETQFEFFASGGSAPLQWLNDAYKTPCGLKESSLEIAPDPRTCNVLHTPTLESLWANHKMSPLSHRKITLIVQGTNFGIKPEIYQEQLRATKKLMKVALANSDECIWIGPPNMRRSPGFDEGGVEYKVSLIKAALELTEKETNKACVFIDSREISQYPTNGDGIHYHWPGSKDSESIERAHQWGEALAARVESILIKP